MRILIAFLIASTISPSFAQETLMPLDRNVGKVIYTEVINCEELPQQVIYDNVARFQVTEGFDVLQNDSGIATLIFKGGFLLPTDRKKYEVSFTLSCFFKDARFKYELTDIEILHHVNASTSSGGFGGYGGTSYTEAQDLTYSLETFYPSRLSSRKPSVRYYEYIRKSQLEQIHREIEKILSGLITEARKSNDW